MTNRLFVINFGIGQAGLATVGYTLYNKDNTVKQARSTTGVFEVGTSTGIYAVYASIDTGFEGIILWDNGAASIRYGVEETVSQLNAIQDETDNIRLIWNSLRNQGTFYAGLVDKVDKLKVIVEALGTVVTKNSPNKKDIIEAIQKIKFPEPIVNIPKFEAPQPIVNIPETKIPDYSNEIKEMKSMINNAISEIRKVPKTQKEYTPNFQSLLSALDDLSKKMSDNAGVNTNKITSEIRTLQNIFVKFDTILSKIQDLQYKMSSLDVNDKAIMNTKNEIGDDIKRLSLLLNQVSLSVMAKENKNISEMMLSFGHKGK